MTPKVVRTEEWPHGLRCFQCKTILNDGDPYSERLYGFVDEVPAVEIVCLTCSVP